MSKFVCVCGNVISDVKYPSRANSIVFSEDSLDRFLRFAGSLLAELKTADSDERRVKWMREQFGVEYPIDASDSEAIEDALSRKVNDFAVSMVRCEYCGRLHIQQKGGVNEYATFSPDDKRRPV